MGIDAEVLTLGFGTRRSRHRGFDFRVPRGIRFETGKLLPARGQRPGAPGRSIADSGSQRSFSGLAYIGRLDRQSILMKSTAYVRAFSKPQVNSCTKNWYTDLPAMFMLGQKPIKRYIHYFNARLSFWLKWQSDRRQAATLYPKATPTPRARLRRRPSAARRVPAAELHQGRLIGGRPHGTPGDQAVRLIHPSTTCQSPKTQQDRERGDELTARAFAPGRSILSTMGAIL